MLVLGRRIEPPWSFLRRKGWGGFFLAVWAAAGAPSRAAVPDAWRMNHLARPWHMAQSYLLHPTLDAPRPLAALCRRHRARGSEQVVRAAELGARQNTTHLFPVEKIFRKAKTTAMDIRIINSCENETKRTEADWF